MDALGADFTIACPAFPANQRTIYKGYLFVGDVLLNESGTRDHPLTPMTDANVLQGQANAGSGLSITPSFPEVHLPSSSAVPRCAEKATASPWSTPYRTKTSCNSVPPAPT